MKALIIAILTLLCMNLVGVLAVNFSDFLSSVIPGWRTNIIPHEIKLLIAVTLNVILPIYFMVKFKLMKSLWFKSYLFLVNLLFYLSYWIERQFDDKQDISIGDYLTLINQIFLLSLTIQVSHIIFYSSLLVRLRKGEVNE